MTTADRGYGYPHQALRKRWAARVKRGGVFCCHPRCGFEILPGEPWDLGHDPVDRSRWLGPMHRKCNRNTTLERRLHGVGLRVFRYRSPSW